MPNETEVFGIARDFPVPIGVEDRCQPITPALATRSCQRERIYLRIIVIFAWQYNVVEPFRHV